MYLKEVKASRTLDMTHLKIGYKLFKVGAEESSPVSEYFQYMVLDPRPTTSYRNRIICQHFEKEQQRKILDGESRNLYERRFSLGDIIKLDVDGKIIFSYGVKKSLICTIKKGAFFMDKESSKNKKSGTNAKRENKVFGKIQLEVKLERNTNRIVQEDSTITNPK